MARKDGRIPNGFGGYSTRKELREFRRNLTERGKGQRAILKRRTQIIDKAYGGDDIEL